MTSYFVDSAGSDSNGGTSTSDAWLTIQKAIDTMATGQANRLNLKGSYTLSAGLDFTTRPYTATQDNWLTIEGYTSTEGDGGVATINGGGNEIINDDNLDAINFRSCKFTNWGVGTAFSLDNYCAFIECEFDGEGSRANVIDADNACLFVRNKVHGIALSGRAIWLPFTSSMVLHNYIQIDNATANDFVIDIGTESIAAFNVLNISGYNSNCIAININGDDTRVFGNSIRNDDTVNGIGIQVDGGGIEGVSIFNNITVGFSTGVSTPTGSQTSMYGHNKFYNNTADESLAGGIIANLGNNVTLGADPFVSTGNVDPDDDDFSVSSALDETGYPDQMYNPDSAFGTRNKNHTSVGALQREVTGGGGGGGIKLAGLGGGLAG